MINTNIPTSFAKNLSTDDLLTTTLVRSRDQSSLISITFIPNSLVVDQFLNTTPIPITTAGNINSNTVNSFGLPPSFKPDNSLLAITPISPVANPYVGTLPILAYPGPDNTSANTPLSNSAPVVSAILPNWISGLKDITIRSDLTAALTNNTKLKVGDLSKMFTDLANGLSTSKSTLTSSQITDLTTIANNIGSISFNPAVEGLAKQLIIGNKSNLSWTNGMATSVALLTTSTASSTFGLKAGDTALQLNELNAKWLLGKDLPSNSFSDSSTKPSTSTTYTYVIPTKGTFGTYGSTASFAPNMNDINQGGVGDCYFECTLAEVAHMNSSIITSMITDNCNDTYAVRFYVNGAPIYITVNKQLLELPTGHAYPTGTEFGNNATYIWASLVEKAFAQLQAQANLVNGDLDGSYAITSGNSFTSIGNGGPCSTPLMEITGATLEQSIYPNDAGNGWNSYSAWNLTTVPNAGSLLNLQNVSNTTVMTDIVDCLAKGYAVTISSTKNVINSAGKTTLVGGHALSIYGVDTDTNMVQVRNPWGGGSDIATQGYATTFEVSVETLLSQGDWFYFVNATSPAPIVNTIDQVIAPATSASIKGVSIYYSSVQPNSSNHRQITAVLTDIAGVLSATASGSASIVKNGPNSISITGSLTDVNATLRTLEDNNPGTSSNTTDDIFVTVTESSGNVTYTGTGIVGLQVASAPSISAQSSPQVLYSQPTVINGLTITDKGAGSSLLSVVVSDTHGLLNTTAVDGLTIAGLNSTSLTLTGKLSAINTALSKLTDTNSTHGNDDLTLTMNDWGTNLHDTATVPIVVGLSVSVLGPNCIGRGIATQISGISILHYNSDATISVVVTNDHGLLNVTSAQGLSIVQLKPNQITLSGTLGVVNAALATLSDTNPTVGADNLSITATDTGTGLSSSGSEFITVANAPALTTSTTSVKAIEINKPTILTGLTITDASAGSSTLVVIISDTNGKLSATGANASAAGKSITLSGSLTTINAALATLKDTSSALGYDALNISIIDTGTGLSSASSITIAVAKFPTINPSDTRVKIIEINKPTILTGLTITDESPGSSALSVTISDTNGTLSATGAKASADGKSITLSGTLAAINAALATLTDTNTKLGSDTLTIAVTDTVTGFSSSTSTNITVANPPTVTLSTTSVKTIQINKATILTGLTITDTSAGSSTLSVTISDTNGTLSATGAKASADGKSITLSGTLAAINAALVTLTDTNTTLGSDTLTIAVKDTGTGLSSSTSTTITVANPPAITVPGSTQTIVSNKASTISGLSITYTAATSTTEIEVVLSDRNGLLNATAPTGLKVTGANTKSLTLKGTLSVVNTALKTLTDTNATLGADNLTMKVTDTGSGFSSTSIEPITVASVPTIAIFTKTIADNLDNKISGLTIVDPSVTTTSKTILTVEIKDTFGLLNATAPATLTINGATSNSLTLSGTLAALNTALGTLTDTNTRDGIDNLTVSVSNPDTGLSATAIESITVASIPTLSIKAKTIAKGQTSSIPGITVTDASAGSNNLSLTISNVHGVLTASGSTPVSGNTITLTGTLSAINTALASLTDNNTTLGPDNLTMKVTDTGSGFSSTSIEPITVASVPTIAIFTKTIADNLDNKISGLTIVDPSVTTTSKTILTVEIKDTFGLLNATAPATLTINGATSNSLTLSGTLAALNTALGTLTDTNTRDGIDNLTVSVSNPDTGLSATASESISVAAPPHITGNVQTIVAATSTSIKGIVVTDPLATASTLLTVTISDKNGLLSANGSVPVSGKSITLSGTLSAINTALASLSDNNPTVGSDNLTITVKDQGNGLIGTGSDTITVRAATKTTATAVSKFTSSSTIAPTGTPIASALHGDTVTIADATTFLSTPLTATATANSLASIVSTAMGALAQHNVGWFNWQGNTYLLEQANGSNSAFGNGDTLVQITGTMDLSHATLANHVITL